jgi:hypothetical protein
MKMKIYFMRILIIGILLLTPSLASAVVSVKILSVSNAADGAGAILKFQVTCSTTFGSGNDFNFYMNANLNQRVTDKKVTSASQYFYNPIICDGRPHKLRTFLLVSSCKIPLKKGSAILNLTGSIYNYYYFNYNNNESFNISRVIEIH